MFYYLTFNSLMGQIIGLSDGSNLTGLYFENQVARPAIHNDWICHSNIKVLSKLKHQINSYFTAERDVFNLPLKFTGTDFQKSIWTALQLIPYGNTISYSDLAQKIGRPGSHRAVANAVSRNPISIIIPCHRVIAKNGSIAGYAGGVYRKKKLLQLESRGRI